MIYQEYPTQTGIGLCVYASIFCLFCFSVRNRPHVCWKMLMMICKKKKKNVQETTSCYLQTTPSLLLFSQTPCDSMHSGTLPFHISYAPEKKKADILGFFAQCWQTELLQQLVLAGISAPSFAVLSACNFAAQSLGFNQSWKKSFE